MGDEFLLVSRTLHSFRTELPAAFQKIHKSYIANRAKVDYLEGNQLALKSGKVLPVGKVHREAVRAWIAPRE